MCTTELYDPTCGQKCDTGRLPLANPDFVSIRELGMLYVDRTELLARIAGQRRPFLFARPRRFGKSLLISTLASLFRDGLQYFQGLAIERIWHDQTYQVVEIDFQLMAEYGADDLIRELGDTLIQRFGMQGIVSQRSEAGIRSPARILDEICTRLSSSSVVLLIDEYDAPRIHHIDDPAELKRITGVLNSFYAAVKKYTGKFRFICITGITRTNHVSIFSGFNNLIDVSLDPDFNTLLGFTKDDIEQYFDPYVENVARILRISREEVYVRLEQYYDGFTFCPGSEETLYNPWSLLSFFSNPKKGFMNYWFESGGTPQIVLQHLKIHEDFDFLDYTTRDIYVGLNELRKIYEITDIPYDILLFQTGYLTIRDEGDGTVHLVVPNSEVEESLSLCARMHEWRRRRLSSRSFFRKNVRS